MEMVYGNVNWVDSSNKTCSHCEGNKVSSSKRTKVLLAVLSVALVLALGGLCVLGIMYSGNFTVCDAPTDQQHNVSKLQSDPEKSVCSVSDGDEKLLHKYNAAKNCLSSCNEFASSLCKPCKDGWTAYRGKCYFFSSKKQTWFDSRDFCVASKAHLVTINKKEIQDFLVRKIEEVHWIGLNDLETEGHWVWMNNQTLHETQLEYWYVKKSGSKEPDNWIGDNASGEDCACLGNEDIYLNSWFDASCQYKNKFICEQPYSFTFTDDK